MVESLYQKILGLDYVKLKENLDLLSDTYIYPIRFLKKVNIKYLSPSDAASTILLEIVSIIIFPQILLNIFMWNFKKYIY